MKRFHIVGAHRSGTTLLLDMAATCFRADGSCPGEMTVYEEPQHIPEDGLFISKQPRDILIIKSILDVDPGLYVIYIYRDPRAVITSINRTHPGMYFCNLRVWNECEEAAACLEGHPRFMTVRYEDLVGDPDAQQARIVEKYPFLEQIHRFSEFHQFSHASKINQDAMNGLRPASKDRIDSWKKHLPRVKAQMQLHPGLEDALIRRGYEPDRSWTSILDNVEPVFSPSRSLDHIPIWMRLDWRWRNWMKYRKKLRALRERQCATTRDLARSA